jgi:hypothetical protein
MAQNNDRNASRYQVVLDERELAEAEALGGARAARWALAASSSVTRLADPYALSVAEFVAAKFIGMPKPTTIDAPHVWQHPRGPLQVRSSLRGDVLRLYDDDPDDHMYFVVDVSAPAGPYRVCGCTTGRRARAGALARSRMS